MPENRQIIAVMIGPYGLAYDARAALAAQRIASDLQRIKGGKAVLRVEDDDALRARSFLCTQTFYDDCVVSAEEGVYFNCMACRMPVDPTMPRCSRCGEAVRGLEGF